MKIQKSLKRLYFVASLLLFEFAASAQTFDGAGKLNNAKTTMLTLGKTVMDIASIATGIIGAILIAWNYFKRGKGDGQSNDSLASLLWGTAIVIILFQIVKVVFFTGA